MMGLVWKWSEVPMGHARGDVQRADLRSDLELKDATETREASELSAVGNKWAPQWNGE